MKRPPTATDSDEPLEGPQLSCFPVLWLTLSLMAGAVTWHFLRLHYSWLTALPGALVAFVATHVMLVNSWSAFLRWRPFFPGCAKCGSRRFQMMPIIESGEGVMLKCRDCEARYLHKDRQLLKVLGDGSVRPYLKHTLFGPWTEDRG
jgi:DNA-directed RNA polymerase subunit RPC12/RpoP